MSSWVKVICYLLIGMILLSLWGYYLAIKPFRIASHHTPETYALHYENINFETSDHITIKGWYIPSPNPHAKTIILLHGYPADKSNILPAMIDLHPYYHLLLFDFRYFGESGGTHTTIGKEEVNDLLGAIKYLKQKNINEVGIWGFSMGGAVALMSAPQAPEIKAIVAESSYARLDWMADEYYHLPLLRYPLALMTRFWGWLFLGYDIKSVSPANAVKQLNIPILIIHSENDEVVSFRHAKLLEASLKNNTKSEVIFIKDLKHGDMMKNHFEIVKSFFDRHLR